MNKSLSLLTLGLVIASFAASAQGIPENNVHPVKFSDVKKQVEEKMVKRSRQAPLSSKAIKEDDNYHDGRWLWYWSQHTDVNGNIVSPVKTLNEWKNYKQQNKAVKSKTTNQSQWSFTGLPVPRVATVASEGSIIWPSIPPILTPF